MLTKESLIEEWACSILDPKLLQATDERIMIDDVPIFPSGRLADICRSPTKMKSIKC